MVSAGGQTAGLETEEETISINGVHQAEELTLTVD